MVDDSARRVGVVEFFKSSYIIRSARTGMMDLVVTLSLRWSTVHLMESQMTEVDSILLEQYSHPPPISEKLTCDRKR